MNYQSIFNRGKSSAIEILAHGIFEAGKLVNGQEITKQDTNEFLHKEGNWSN